MSEHSPQSPTPGEPAQPGEAIAPAVPSGGVDKVARVVVGVPITTTARATERDRVARTFTPTETSHARAAKPDPLALVPPGRAVRPGRRLLPHRGVRGYPGAAARRRRAPRAEQDRP